jgi:hypothetical protein
MIKLLLVTIRPSSWKPPAAYHFATQHIVADHRKQEAVRKTSFQRQ